MATKVLSNEFIQKIAEEEACKDLFGDLSWMGWRVYWRSIRTKLIGRKFHRTQTFCGLFQCV